MLEMSQAESMVRPSGNPVDGLVPAEGLQERTISHGIFVGVTGTRKAPGSLVIESSFVPEGLLTVGCGPFKWTACAKEEW